MAYDDPKINLLLTYEGGEVQWINTYERDRGGFVEKIRAYAAVLDDQYQTHLDDEDDERIRLAVKFRTDSTVARRLKLKGELFALIADTNWGGPG